jgi:hypothetical protein
MALSKDTATIRESADPDKNTAKGGHVTQHISGMTPPPEMSQRGKTLFKSRKDFENIWRRCMHDAAGVNCSANQVQALTVHCHLSAGRTRAGRIWNRAEKSCPVGSRSVMELGEAAHHSRSGTGHAPGRPVRAVPRGRRGARAPGVAFEPYNRRGHHRVSVRAAIRP